MHPPRGGLRLRLRGTARPPGHRWGPPPKKGGTRLVGLAVLGGAVALLVGLVTALGGERGGKPTTTGAGASSSPGRPSPFLPAVPKLTAEQTEGLLVGLRKIDPALDEPRSVERARNICSDLLNGKDRDQVIKNAKIRFDGGDAGIGTADARKIMYVILQAGWCEIG
ncbi:hypothetical protein [Streptosporangium sp. NPDC051022]|uniref:hypothetical protein n=1 Tax=Streptosporangium sp. NPDC051022 TaxID=3155752 RepID=UPI00342CBCB3